MIWGFAGPWPGEFQMRNGEWIRDASERFWHQFDFLTEYGFRCMGMGLKTVDDLSEADRAKLAQLLVDRDMRLSAIVGFNFLDATPDEAKRKTDEIVDQMRKYLGLMRTPICTTGAAAGHRFDRVMPLEEKLERLARNMAPLAAACAELGAPLGIENHCDYYISDLIELCRRTPHLYLFLDTGNTFMIGEKPLAAFAEAAPYTIGTHFKDHRVRPVPDGRPMHFEVTGAALGEGDVPLRECWDLLKKHAPNFDKLTMEIEMISPAPEVMTPTECMRRSVAFIRSLK